MICGLGTDLTEIPRIRAAYARWGERFLRKVFTEEEIAYCLRPRVSRPRRRGRKRWARASRGVWGGNRFLYPANGDKHRKSE